VKLVDGVLRDPYFGGAAFSVSETGILVYQQGKPFEGYGIRVFDRSGKQIAGTVEPDCTSTCDFPRTERRLRITRRFYRPVR